MFDLSVLGGGVAALWLALKATDRGLRVLVVHPGELGGFASSGSQGWMHSGALYAAYGSTELVAPCRAGSAEIFDLCAGAGTVVAAGTAGFLGMSGRDERAGIAERIRATGLYAEVVERDAVEDLTPFAGLADFFVRTGDASMDTDLLLRTLADRAFGAGAVFARCAGIDALSFRSRDGSWRVEDAAELAVDTANLVVALGGAGERVVRNNGGSPSATMEVGTRVVAVEAPDLPPVMVAVLGGEAVNVVPLVDAGVVTGATVTFSFDNAPVARPEVPVSEIRDLLARSPAFRAVLRCAAGGYSPTTTIRPYRCWKLQGRAEAAGTPASRAPRVERLDEGLFSLSAGKLTTASVAAGQCLERVLGERAPSAGRPRAARPDRLPASSAPPPPAPRRGRTAPAMTVDVDTFEVAAG